MYNLDARGERFLLALLALTQFTVIMDFMVMMPLGPQIMHSFQITPTGFATAVSAYSWCSGLSGLFAATYIDRFDRRKLLVFVYALFALSNLACALSTTFSLLLVARAFAGITGGVLGSVIMAIVSDVIPATRRGAATGTIMLAMSMAAIVGVPTGILLGARFGWATPFILLTVMSAIICVLALKIVPVLNQHLDRKQPALNEVLPALWSLLSEPRHVKAFVLTFMVMGSTMMVIPFISPMLVANHGVEPAHLSWLYMAGGGATFFTSQRIGKFADAYGSHRIFRIMTVFSMLPILIVTHLPTVPFVALLLLFPILMVAMSGRMVPMQALITRVPQANERGAFLSANSAVMALGNGCGAWLGGLFLSSGPNGSIEGYGTNGWVSTAVFILAILWIGRVQGLSGGPVPGSAAAPKPAGVVSE